MRRGNAWRQHESIIIGMSHNHRANQPRRNAPRCRPTILLRSAHTRKLHFLCLSEVLSEEVRGAGLQRLAVLHHRFD